MSFHIKKQQLFSITAPMFNLCSIVTNHWRENSGIFTFRSFAIRNHSYFLFVYLKYKNLQLIIWSLWLSWSWVTLGIPGSPSSHRKILWLEIHIVIMFLKNNQQLQISEGYQNSKSQKWPKCMTPEFLLSWILFHKWPQSCLPTRCLSAAWRMGSDSSRSYMQSF